jgi:Domain of unknown function (DUF6285)
MHDSPTPEQLLAAVADFLRTEAGPALARAGDTALAYQARVAANMLGMAGRQLAHAALHDAAELARLRLLLHDPAGDLPTLNQRLADGLASGALHLATPGLADHLWRTTLAKLAVDQPRHATYQRARAALPAAD